MSHSSAAKPAFWGCIPLVLLLFLPAAAQNGGISGLVTDEQGLGINDIWVKVYDLGGNSKGSYYSDFNGNYSFTGLPPGSYKIHFHNWRSSVNYVSEWYNDKPSFAAANPVVVSAGAVTRGINARLSTGGEFAGRVTDASGSGIGNIRVHAYDLTGNDLGEATCDPEGNYRYRGLSSGDYKIHFFNNGLNYLSEWYNDRGSQSAADPVAVTAGSVTAGIDAQLVPSGQISGRVSDVTGIGIQWVYAYVFDSPGHILRSVQTDANGDYTIGALDTASYRIQFMPASSNPDYLTEWYNDKGSYETADPVAVTAGIVTKGVDVQLAAGGRISGRITDASGAPIRDIGVSAQDTAYPNNYLGRSGYSDENGNFTIKGLWTGTFKLHFGPEWDWQNYLGEWYNDKEWYSLADPVAVTAGLTTAGIDAQLATGGEIFGRVTTASGTGIKDVQIAVYPADHEYVTKIAYTDADGNYRALPLRSGSYKFQFVADGLNFKSEWHSDKADFATADPINVTAGAPGVRVDAVLTGEAISAPAAPKGPAKGVMFTGYAFSAGGSVSTFGHAVQYLFEWGDGTSTDWLPTGNHGASHAWTSTGTFAVRVKARCTTHTTIESPWSAPLTITINDRFLTVTSPIADVEWEKSRTYAIRWLKHGTTNANVTILLFKEAGTLASTVSGSTANDESFDWTIPSGIPRGAYFIRVKAIGSPIQADSDPFYIFAPSITVVWPEAGNTWLWGTTHSIRWSREGTLDSLVSIKLLKDGIVKLNIASSTENDGAFDWTIPPTLAKGTYSIRIQTLDGKVKGTSKAFTITSGVMLVIAPAAGASWQRGQPHLIAWARQGDLIDDEVRIQLFKGTELWTTLALATANDGGFEWTIPANQPLAANYRVRVKTRDNLVSADSGKFSVTADAGLTLLAPNGDAPLRPREPLVVRWTVDPGVMDVKLEFSRDNGSTYAVIADSAPNTGRFDWPAPPLLTRNGIVRVSDASGRPWEGEGVLEVAFRYRCAGQGDGPAFRLWFGGGDPRDPGHGFAEISIGGDEIGFAGLSRAVEPAVGNWHDMKIRLDLRRDAADIEVDGRPLFENAALGTTRERFFQPLLALQACGGEPADLAVDDLAVAVVQADEAGGEPRRFSVLRDDFERYDDEANPLRSCWQGTSSVIGEARAWLDRGEPGNQALRLRSAAGTPLLVLLPFSLPERIPFDISDRQLTVEPEKLRED